MLNNGSYQDQDHTRHKIEHSYFNSMKITGILLVAATCIVVAESSSHHDLLKHANDIEEWIVSHRRQLHQFPELMFKVYQYKVLDINAVLAEDTTHKLNPL